MHPMVAIGVGFTAHAVFTSVSSICSNRSAMLETDVSTADILLLPLSVGSGRYLARRANTEAAMKVSTMALMDTPSETPMEDTVVDQEEKGENV